MPETIACPSCEGKLRIKEEMLGKKVKCPKCEKIFVAEVEEKQEEEELDEMEVLDERPAKKRRDEEDEDEDERGITDRPRARSSRRDEEEDEDDRPARRRSRDEDEDRPRGRRSRDEEEDEERPRRRSRDEEDDEEDEDDRPRNRKRDKKGGWKKAYQGVNLVVISMYATGGVFVGLLALFVCGFVMGASALGAGGLDPASLMRSGVVLILLGGLVSLTWIAAEVLSLIGYGFLLAIPSNRDSGAKALAIATFSCYAAGFFFYLVGILVGIVGILSYIAYTGGFVCSLFLLRSIAFLCRDRGLAQAFITCLIGSLAAGAGVIALICIFSFVAGFSMAGAGPGAMAGVGVGFLIMFLLLLGTFIGIFVWKLLLTMRVREAVVRAYGRTIGLR